MPTATHKVDAFFSSLVRRRYVVVTWFGTRIKKKNTFLLYFTPTVLGEFNVMK